MKRYHGIRALCEDQLTDDGKLHFGDYLGLFIISFTLMFAGVVVWLMTGVN